MASAIIPANTPELNIVDGRPVVSSLSIAEHFEKQHFQVLRDIRAISEEMPEDLRASNFVCSHYHGSTPTGGKRSYPLYLLSRDGFTLVAMGFTGKKALEWKVKYIQAFNDMERALLEGHHGQPVCLPPTELTPDQRRHLHDVMDAKVSAIPNESRRAAYSEGWTRFNRHFRIAKYEQLPPERFTEALEYLIALKLKTGQRALPATQAALPALPTDLRHRLAEHARACLDFGSEFYARYTKLQAESRALAGDLRQHISATPSFDSSPSGALARERVYDAMTTFARRGGTIVEAGTDNLYMTARLMEGLAGMK
ncbi:Rha family transcriptional regulator [Oleidesulfovibrio sp.]|uniref:Rha family transcriptional regulator n=1 Tax=Oleidesulfovibrio sp. TaxID=2909707 RepID=UPI003A84EF3C